MFKNDEYGFKEDIQTLISPDRYTKPLNASGTGMIFYGNRLSNDRLLYGPYETSIGKWKIRSTTNSGTNFASPTISLTQTTTGFRNISSSSSFRFINDNTNATFQGKSVGTTSTGVYYVLAHNKTLAEQLYGEFKSIFP